MPANVHTRHYAIYTRDDENNNYFATASPCALGSVGIVMQCKLFKAIIMEKFSSAAVYQTLLGVCFVVRLKDGAAVRRETRSNWKGNSLLLLCTDKTMFFSFHIYKHVKVERSTIPMVCIWYRHIWVFDRWRGWYRAIPWHVTNWATNIWFINKMQSALSCCVFVFVLL